MKILFFIESLITGGTQRRLIELITFLKQNSNHELAVVITEEEVHFNSIVESGIQVTLIKRNGVKYDPRLFLEFAKYCKSFKPDIIHTWGIMTTTYAVPAKFIYKAKLISNIINDSNKVFKILSLKNFFFKIDILFSDLILANSKAGISVYNVTSQKAKIIYNGVNLNRFQQEYNIEKIRNRLGVKTKYIAMMVASFSKYKDYDLFVDIARKMMAERTDLTFVGVGDGPELNRIQKRVEDEEVHNVLLIGSQVHVEELLAASDFGLLCTFSEGISNSIIEYMAMGKPAISTDMTGGTKELIVDGKTGYCVERNADKVIALINALLNDKTLRDEMGKSGKERIFSQFSIERFGKEMMELYDNMIGE